MQSMDTGSFRVGANDEAYEQLFVEALRDGFISDGERERLDLAAKALGLDPERAASLEAALRTAMFPGTSRDTIPDIEGPAGFGDLGESDGHLSISVETTGRKRALSISFEPTDDDSQAETAPRPRARETGRDAIDALHARFDACRAAGNVDGQWCASAVLVRRTEATRTERDFYLAHATATSLRPKRALTREAWSLLFHAEEDRLTSEIFALIAPSALLGRLAALRADRALARLDESERQDVTRSTVSAVRALAWAAATMGLQVPPIYVSPQIDVGLEVVLHLPPASRIGARMLSGHGIGRLAFHSARHLTWFREEYFVCTLVPSVEHLRDLFVAALALGAPELDLRADVRARASLIADAIAPVLEPAKHARLGQLVSQFIGQGGRTDLQAWARAASFTAARAGLLLSGDFETACGAISEEPNSGDRVRDLEAFWSGDAATDLRQRLGVALPADT